jgi:hypothetical protein
MRRIPDDLDLRTGILNSLFRAEQGIQDNLLTINDKKCVSGVENGSDQGISNFFTGFPAPAGL